MRIKSVFGLISLTKTKFNRWIALIVKESRNQKLQHYQSIDKIEIFFLHFMNLPHKRVQFDGRDLSFNQILMCLYFWTLWAGNVFTVNYRLKDHGHLYDQRLEYCCQRHTNKTLWHLISNSHCQPIRCQCGSERRKSNGKKQKTHSSLIA